MVGNAVLVYGDLRNGRLDYAVKAYGLPLRRVRVNDDIGFNDRCMLRVMSVRYYAVNVSRAMLLADREGVSLRFVGLTLFVFRWTGDDVSVHVQDLYTPRDLDNDGNVMG